MSFFRKCASVAVAMLCGGLGLTNFVSSQNASSIHNQAGSPPGKDRARIVLSRPLSKLDGDHLKAILVEVNYGPAEASSPHSHPCAVMAYVVEGTLRTQVQGEPETIYKAGESFYEAPHGVHVVSTNASTTKPAKFVAYMICDHDTPLSVAAAESPAEGSK